VDFRLADLIRVRAREHPGAPAVTGDGRIVSYAELDERSSRLAAALRAEGVTEGERVVHLAKNSAEQLETLFGAAKAGAVSVMLNWRLTVAELAAVIADTRAEVLIADAEYAAAAYDLLVAVPGIRRLVIVGDDDPETGYEAWLAGRAADDPGFTGDDDTVVVQLYTSGTTGQPKGVQLTNANCGVVAPYVSPRWQVDASASCLVAMPMFHIGGLGMALIALWNGARSVLVREIVPDALLDVIERERITNAFLVPAVLQFCCAVPGAAGRDFSALRSVAYGASPITVPVLRRAMETLRCPLFQVYGLTEVCGAIVQLDAADHDPGGPREHLLRSAGKPYPWVELMIADPVTGERREAGETGEILTRSAQNTPGYWHQPEETKRLYTADGWLRTGDAGYLDGDGYLFITDRIKDMIVTGGENVYPIEVEQVLAAHPDVADVAVIGTPDQRWGEAVTAVVVLREGADVAETELSEFTRGKIAGYKRPKRITFATSLPRSATGKVLKRELRASACPSLNGQADDPRLGAAFQDPARAPDDAAERVVSHHRADVRLRLDPARQAGQQRASAGQPDLPPEHVLGEAGRSVGQYLLHRTDDGGDYPLDRRRHEGAGHALGARRPPRDVDADDLRRSRRSPGEPERRLQRLRGLAADRQPELGPHGMHDRVVHRIAREPQRLGPRHGAAGDHRDLGGTAPDVHDERPRPFGKLDAGTGGSGDRLGEETYAVASVPRSQHGDDGLALDPRRPARHAHQD
jgi:long-chain acyl-CoA synthetase